MGLQKRPATNAPHGATEPKFSKLETTGSTTGGRATTGAALSQHGVPTLPVEGERDYWELLKEEDEVSEEPARPPLAARRGDDSEMSERLATEQPLEEYALAWDMRSYTLAEFIIYYGVPDAHDFWQPSLHATVDARAAIKNLHEVDGPALANFWALISGWVPTAPTVEAANDLMLSAFYIPLRWRYEFLQSRDVLPEMWSSCDLSAQQDQKATWAYVKDSVATFRRGCMVVRVSEANVWKQRSTTERFLAALGMAVRRRKFVKTRTPCPPFFSEK